MPVGLVFVCLLIGLKLCYCWYGIGHVLKLCYCWSGVFVLFSIEHGQWATVLTLGNNF
jgi:hypothetical protein